MLNLLFAIVLQSPVQIGYPTDLLPLSKQFPGIEKSKVYPPRRGATWVTLYAGQPQFEPGKYILASEDIMPNPDGWPYSPQGEMVEIEKWTTSSTGTRRGYFPAHQQLWTNWRGKSAWLVKAPIQTGGVYFVTEPTKFSCVDDVDIYVGPAAAGWNAPAFLEINFSRRVRIYGSGPGTGIVGAPLDTSPGMGYLAKIQRSTIINAQGLRGDGVRHGFEAFGGAQMFCGSLEITNPRGTVFGGHGMGAVDLYASGIKGGGANIAIGNKGAYGDEAEVWMVENCGNLWLHGPSKVRVYDSKFNGPISFERNGYGEPISFDATRCTFKAYIGGQPIHYEGIGPWTVVPNLVNCTLVPAPIPDPPPPFLGFFEVLNHGIVRVDRR